MKHPAKYSKEILPVLQACVAGIGWNITVLDPMGGVGGVHALSRRGIQTVSNELEYEWAAEHPAMGVQGNALCLPFPSGRFNGIVVSPTYANRMADHHEAKDDSKRNTYRHTLGRPLHPENSGQMQWGAAYRTFHEAAWQESLRVLSPTPSARFILNISNHIRAGQEVDVTGWHKTLLESLGLSVCERYEVRTQRNKQGANGAARVPFESVLVFKRL